jgi:hypothetical protein
LNLGWTQTIQEIKKLDSIFESDILDSELCILDWIFYQVYMNQQKNLSDSKLHILYHL